MIETAFQDQFLGKKFKIYGSHKALILQKRSPEYWTLTPSAGDLFLQNTMFNIDDFTGDVSLEAGQASIEMFFP